jgi:hypothetical protein
MQVEQDSVTQYVEKLSEDVARRRREVSMRRFEKDRQELLLDRLG